MGKRTVARWFGTRSIPDQNRDGTPCREPAAAVAHPGRAATAHGMPAGAARPGHSSAR